MTARQQWLVVAIVVALLGGGLFTASRLLRDELQPLVVGNAAPMFSAVTIDSALTTKTLADYKGEVVLLNVWGPWCGPCREEMPSIDSLYQTLKPKGLRVVAVSIDQMQSGSSHLNEIRDFVAHYKLSFEVLYDTLGAIKQQYQTTGAPETFILARDGTIRRKIIGPENWNSDDNRRLIESLLAEPRR